jgi:hypothetical protein
MQVIVKNWGDVEAEPGARPGSTAWHLAAAEEGSTTVILLGAPRGACMSDRKLGPDGWFYVGIETEADDIALLPAA